MENTHAAIMLDVKGGFYTPDDAGKATLASWEESNRVARETLETDK